MQYGMVKYHKLKTQCTETKALQDPSLQLRPMHTVTLIINLYMHTYKDPGTNHREALYAVMHHEWCFCAVLQHIFTHRSLGLHFLVEWGPKSESMSKVAPRTSFLMRYSAAL